MHICIECGQGRCRCCCCVAIETMVLEHFTSHTQRYSPSWSLMCTSSGMLLPSFCMCLVSSLIRASDSAGGHICGPRGELMVVRLFVLSVVAIAMTRSYTGRGDRRRKKNADASMRIDSILLYSLYCCSDNPKCPPKIAKSPDPRNISEINQAVADAQTYNPV